MNIALKIFHAQMINLVLRIIYPSYDSDLIDKEMRFEDVGLLGGTIIRKVFSTNETSKKYNPKLEYIFSIAGETGIPPCRYLNDFFQIGDEILKILKEENF